MSETTDIKRQIEGLVKEHFAVTCSKEKFVPGKTRIPLIGPSYDWEEVVEALDSFLSTQVTMGQKVGQFESMFAEYVGTRYASMVNSGSSANLLALSVLTNPSLDNRIEAGDEIITPAVTWATTVWPIINCGAVPVLVDVDLETFNIETVEIEKAITSKTKAIMVVHLLGNPCRMDEVARIAKEHNLFVIEDSCEAHGAEIAGHKVGSFGDLATFSFFFSHHISTIEGGMVLTSSERLAELVKALRVFGWVRDLGDKDLLSKKHEDIDPRYLFVNIGFNFRPTEIQGAFGTRQMQKLDTFVENRRENAQYWSCNLKQFGDHIQLQDEREGTKHTWFAYPITVKPDAPYTRKELVDFLEEKGLETRPIMAGNICEQPAMSLFPHRAVGELPNSRFIARNSFFFGNHPGIGIEEREAVIEYIREFELTKTGSHQAKHVIGI